MLQAIRSKLAVVGLCLGLSACALSQTTEDVVVDYNRAFAKSRDELLLLNILRASAREPLQFSTMGTVTGAVGNTSQLEIPLTRLIAGGANEISPKLLFGDAINPTINIVPLGFKEFASGILSPLRPETINLFLHSGWDAEFLLPLVVGAVICPDYRILLNSGEYSEDGVPTPQHQKFMTFFYHYARDFRVGSPTMRTFTVDQKDALAAVRDGLGPNLTLLSVTEKNEGKSQLTVRDHNLNMVQGNDRAMAELCSQTNTTSAKAFSPETFPGSVGIAGQTRGRVVFRSVGSIIHYLGESHRVRYKAGDSPRPALTYFNRYGEPQILFKIDWWLSNRPRAVETEFQDTVFYVPRIDLRHGEDEDRSMKTLSFLDQLIALQTSESVIRGSQPIVTISP